MASPPKTPVRSPEEVMAENESLRQRLAEAETASRKKDEFLATLAHEMRNPIAPLQNALSLISHPNTKAEIRQQAYAIMGRQLVQMKRLVDDLLDLSRIAQNKIELDIKRVSISDIIKNAVETISPLVEERKHKLSIGLPAPAYIDADLGRMSQVFANVLHNAVKYTQMEGEISVTGKIEDGNIVVTVRDNGIGIDKDLLPHIFDMFTQSDDSAVRSHAGLGIGLTLVRNLLELHAGRIEAKSDGAGKGSRFIITLPLSITATAGDAIEKEVMPAAKPCKVLVVDDNIASAQTVGWMLEAIGHEAHLLFDGKEVVARALELLPDAILLDIGLPGKNGYEICRELRALPALKNTLLIAQTGWAQDKDKATAKEAGFDHHLVKPFDLDVLSALLNSL